LEDSTADGQEGHVRLTTPVLNVSGFEAVVPVVDDRT
jgi:hypothetical protein